jgi:hypothetical protein
MTVDGEPTKRYGVSCDGEVVGSYDTVQEAWDAWKAHQRDILPVLKRNSKRSLGRYVYRVGRKEMTFEQFRMAREREKSGKT